MPADICRANMCSCDVGCGLLWRLIRVLAKFPEAFNALPLWTSGFWTPLFFKVANTNVSQGVSYGLASAIAASWGNAMSVHMVVANSIHHG